MPVRLNTLPTSRQKAARDDFARAIAMEDRVMRVIDAVTTRALGYGTLAIATEMTTPAAYSPSGMMVGFGIAAAFDAARLSVLAANALVNGNALRTLPATVRAGIVATTLHISGQQLKPLSAHTQPQARRRGLPLVARRIV